MKTLKNRLVRGPLAMVLTIVLAWLIAAPVFAADEETEESICAATFKKCMADAIFSGLLSWGSTIILFLSFCFVGYDFCARYIDKLA